MLSVYLGSMVFGGLLIVVSLLFGDADSDADFDADADMDLDADMDIDAEADADGFGVDDALDAAGQGTHDAMWLPFLSLRFWTFGLAAFGLAGTLMTVLTGSPLLALPLALVTGVLMGGLVAWLFRRLKDETVTAKTGLEHYVGQEARVLLDIRPGGTGKIIIDSMGGSVQLLARTGDDKPIERGSTVLVAHIEDDGVADVTGLSGGGGVGARQPQRAPQ